MSGTRHQASLRDPAGYLVTIGNRLIRIIRPESANDYRLLLTGSWLREQCKSKTVVDFRVMDANEAFELVGDEAVNCLCLEHPVVSFPSFPSEWPLEMLCAAAGHTLALCLHALKQGIGLKDATPFNILFQGPRPILVDLLSFETRDKHDPIWLANGQFVRSFLLPALLDARYGMNCHATFLTRRDGIDPEEAYRLLSPMARVTPPFLGYVTLPVLLGPRAERDAAKIYARKLLPSADQAMFILESLFSRLGRAIHASSTRRNKVDTWTNYNDTCTYSATDFAWKTAFVEKFLESSRPAKVLDVGCNTGHFSFLAARSGASVVAIDIEPAAVGGLWRRTKEEDANILPLVVNLSWPSPALGWRNREIPSFLVRAEGYFDAVLMLAVVHHLLVVDQIPLDEIIDQASRLTTEWLVIEYVGPDDSQFRRLLRGRDAQYGWYGRDAFEKALGKRFAIVHQDEVAGNGRRLYLARRRNEH